MAQQIKQANIFGRIGTGLGRGLAEQLPKEVERNRLASGLERLGEQKGLTPFQQFTGLVSAAHEYPQVVQSGERLLAQQARGNAYTNAYLNDLDQSGQNPQASADITPVQQKQFLDNITRGSPTTGQMGQRVQPQGQPLANPDENTFNPAAKTMLPWTPQRMNQEISRGIKNGLLPDEAIRLAQDKEARELGIPKALQQRQAEDKARNEDANKELDRQLNLKLQKKGDAQYKDTTGEFLAGTQKKMNEMLRTNPNLSLADAADMFSTMLLDTAKSKNSFDKKAATTGIESFPKSNELLKDLKAYSNNFRESGNSEEYSNMLTRDPNDLENPGFGMSSQGAATIAYDVNKNPRLKSYIDSYKPVHTSPTRYGNIYDPKIIEANSRRAAREVVKHMDENDSLLSAATALSKQDPSFNQSAFFDEFIENPDDFGLTARQKREIPERNTDWLPTWGDIMVLPWFRRRK